MRILLLVDQSKYAIVPMAQAACSAMADHQLVWQELSDGALPDGPWDGVIVTPGQQGIPASMQNCGVFLIEVQPENTHETGIDHAPSGADALLLGAGVVGYAHALELMLQREAGR